MRWRLFFASVAALAAANSVAWSAETTEYVYDELGRLIAVNNSGGPRNGKSALTAYDPAGNRASQAVGVPAPPPPPNAAIFTISGPAAPVDEGQNAVFTVSKSGTAGTDLGVNFSTINGTASAPGDFAASSGTLTFRSWETAKTISVPILVDGLTETAESFSVQLSSPSPGSSISQSAASAQINASSEGAPGGGANNPPVTAPNSVAVGVCKSTSVNVVANDSDPDGDSIYLVNAGSSSLAQLTIASTTTIAVTGYGTPGSQNVTYTISDGKTTATGTLLVQVVAGNGCN